MLYHDGILRSECWECAFSVGEKEGLSADCGSWEVFVRYVFGEYRMKGSVWQDKMSAVFVYILKTDLFA